MKKNPILLVKTKGVIPIFSKRTYGSMLHLPGLLLPVPLTSQQAAVNPSLCQTLPNTHSRWVQLCDSLSILWHCLSLGLEWKLTFSSLVATAESSKFADILSAALSQHHRFPGDLHNPGSEPRSPSLQADSLPAESPGKPNKIPRKTEKINEKKPYTISQN